MVLHIGMLFSQLDLPNMFVCVCESLPHINGIRMKYFSTRFVNMFVQLFSGAEVESSRDEKGEPNRNNREFITLI